MKDNKLANQTFLPKSVILLRATFHILSSKLLHIFHVSSNSPSYPLPKTEGLPGLQGKLSYLPDPV